LDNQKKNSEDSITTRWLRRFPLLRAYPALQDLRRELGEARQKIKALSGDVKRANALAAQRELALRSVGGGELQMLAEPAFSHHHLAEIARDRSSMYRSAEPFPHLIEDGLFNPAILDRVAGEFQAMDRGDWHHSQATHERKWSTEDARQMGPFTSALISQLNAGPFVSFLEELTGIGGLVPDPHLRGGGLHEIRQGGLLGVHADFNVHPRLRLYRRLNLLVYLNKDWEQEWGGALELWDRGGQRCVRAIQPVFNRAVLFDTSNFSYHGHPHPLACPPERSRKSVALYYYALESPGESDRAAHGTIFLDTDQTGVKTITSDRR
jgi:Rps23 Pro-64 3,4-dihydroxylase Tpa1-like proline 4-hydroxylase